MGAEAQHSRQVGLGGVWMAAQACPGARGVVSTTGAFPQSSSCRFSPFRMLALLVPCVCRGRGAGAQTPIEAPQPIPIGETGLLRVDASSSCSGSPQNEHAHAKTRQGRQCAHGRPWAWSSMGSLPAIIQPGEQQISSRFQADGRDSAERPVEGSDHHLHCTSILAPHRWGAEHQSRGGASTACMRALGLGNQALSALGLPEPAERHLSYNTYEVCQVQALGWGLEGAGAVPQVTFQGCPGCWEGSTGPPWLEVSMATAELEVGHIGGVQSRPESCLCGLEVGALASWGLLSKWGKVLLQVSCGGKLPHSALYTGPSKCHTPK